MAFLLSQLGGQSARAWTARLSAVGIEPREAMLLRHVALSEGSSQQAGRDLDRVAGQSNRRARRSPRGPRLDRAALGRHRSPAPCALPQSARTEGARPDLCRRRRARACVHPPVGVSRTRRADPPLGADRQRRGPHRRRASGLRRSSSRPDPGNKLGVSGSLGPLDRRAARPDHRVSTPRRSVARTRACLL